MFVEDTSYELEASPLMHSRPRRNSAGPVAAARQRVPIKFTRDYIIRSGNFWTKENKMHGFLNVLGAAYRG
jgi:hypothetical protein